MKTSKFVDRWSGFLRYVELYEECKNANNSQKDVFLREWTPMRFCTKDYVLCVYVARVRQKRFEVALFLAGEHSFYVKGAGAMGGLMFCLSDAYFKTGTMEIFFVGPTDKMQSNTTKGFEPEIPRQIQQLAESFGIELRQQSHITNFEGRALYARITGFSEVVIEQLERRKADPVHAAFLVNRCVWSANAIELIANYSTNPVIVLNGGHRADDRLNFKRDMILLKSAIMSDRLKTKIEIELGDDYGMVTCQWSSMFEQQVSVPAPVEISSWSGNEIRLTPESSIKTIFLGRNTEMYQHKLLSDLQSLIVDNREFIRNTLKANPLIDPLIVVLTKDVDWVDNAVKEEALLLAMANGIKFFVVVDTDGELEQEVLNKLAQSETTRKPTEERPE